MSNSFETPWTAALQAPLSVGFPEQESWSGLPFLSPGDLPEAGIEPTFPALQADSLPLSHEPPGNLWVLIRIHKNVSEYKLICPPKEIHGIQLNDGFTFPTHIRHWVASLGRQDPEISCLSATNEGAVGDGEGQVQEGISEEVT